MGILNATPDSFSDGGDLASVDAAVARGLAMEAAGAAILDVGGESTRPGADEVPAAVELDRVIPVIEALASETSVPISIDTRKASVFTAAYAAGASLVNDVSGLDHDPELAEAVARTDAAVILMHMRGEPDTMDGLASYVDPVREVREALEVLVARAEAAGIDRERCLVDPGLGFAKTAEQSLELLRCVSATRPDGIALCLGPSRKRFLGAVTGRESPRERDAATAMACGWLALEGVEMVRVHDVAGCCDAVALAEALAPRIEAGTTERSTNRVRGRARADRSA